MTLTATANAKGTTWSTCIITRKHWSPSEVSARPGSVGPERRECCCSQAAATLRSLLTASCALEERRRDGPGRISSSSPSTVVVDI